MSQGLLDYSHVSQSLSKFSCSNIKALLSFYELIFEMRKRGKGESSITSEAAKLALEEMDAEEQKLRPKKVQLTGVEIVSPMFVLTPEIARRADEHAAKLAEEKKKKKKKKEQYIVQREEKLKSLRLDNCDDFYVQKLAEVKAIAGEVEQEAVKEVQEMLEKIQETSGAGASEAIPESAAPESASGLINQKLQVILLISTQPK